MTTPKSKRDHPKHTTQEYVKHILNRHAGEVRYWGPRRWKEFPAALMGELRTAKFWSYQYAKTATARTLVHNRIVVQGGTQPLSEEEVNRI